MPYVRRHGNQLAIVHGARDPDTRQVRQQPLFTLYSKPEAIEAAGEGAFLHRLLELHYPSIRFDWKKIAAGIREHADVLPDDYPYAARAQNERFRAALVDFTRELLQADPQSLEPAAAMLRAHRRELEFVRDEIEWQLSLLDRDTDLANPDNAWFWRTRMRGTDVPLGAMEHISGRMEREEYEEAAAELQLLIEAFPDYADGHNSLGIIALDRDDAIGALEHFDRAVEVGRRLFPARLGKRSYWQLHETRPFVRGLRNRTLALLRLRRYTEALEACDRLERQCGDEMAASSYRASAYVNLERWDEADRAARWVSEIWPSHDFIAAFSAFELGEVAEATWRFLHAALHHPRAARMLLGIRTGQPTTRDQAEDHNTGVDLLRDLQAWRKRPVGKRYFGKLVRREEVAALLDEIEAVVVRWHEQHRTGDREAFDRMGEMKSVEFAKARARELT